MDMEFGDYIIRVEDISSNAVPEGKYVARWNVFGIPDKQSGKPVAFGVCDLQTSKEIADHAAAAAAINWIKQSNASKEDAKIALLQEIGLNERHFNSLQSEYRKLASGWMLAALGALGWIHAHPTPSENAKIAFTLAIGSAIGVFVLWVLDQKIYHRLLEGSFKSAMAIEEQFHLGCELPHKNMEELVGKGEVARKAKLFYGLIASASPACALFLEWRDLRAQHLALLLVLSISAIYCVLWAVKEDVCIGLERRGWRTKAEEPRQYSAPSSTSQSR
ncbi:hypothetical protein [Dyella nitratireducens]|uniref:hypothetical protein n=1 Tax=Dyella nitratireducens TaxID=1849580 RepID=UPI00166315C8|nr:hypothetical protein [Dyella nitratireducens]